MLWNGSRGIGTEILGSRSHAHRHILVRAVIAALELGDLVLAREGPRAANRHHRPLCAGVRKAHRIQRGHALAQILRKPHLRLSGPAERVAPLRLLLKNRNYVGMRMPHDVRSSVNHEVEVAVPIDIIDIMPLGMVNECRVGREVRRAARAAARQVLRRLILQRLRLRCARHKLLYFGFGPRCCHCEMLLEVFKSL